MTPTKLLVGQILIVFAIVFAGVWASTQWCAAQLGYQAQLGPAWFMAGDTPVYQPWSIFPWWYHYEAYAPEIFYRAGMLAGSSGFLGCAAAIAGSLWRARQSRHVTTYGSARWATVREIERNGLFGDAGIFFGRKHGRYRWRGFDPNSRFGLRRFWTETQSWSDDQRWPGRWPIKSPIF